MSNLCPFKKLLCLLLLAIAICIVPVKASSMTFREYEGIKDAFTNALGKLRDTIEDFGTLKGERDVVKALYDLNAEEIRDQGIEAAHQGVSIPFIIALGPLAPAATITELRQAITNAQLTATDLVEGVRLAKALDIAINKTDKLRTKIGDPQNGSQPATGLFKARDDAYDAYVKAYKEYYSPTATPTLAKGRQNAVLDTTSFSYGCFGSDDCDDTFGSPNAAMTSHFVQCQEKPHKAQEFGWYSCERSSCPKSDEHWRLCPGTCSKKFAPKKIGRNGHYVYVNNSPHKVVCEERVYDGFWNVITNLCHIKYDSVWYTCEHSQCPNSTYHTDDDDDNDDNDDDDSTEQDTEGLQTEETQTSTPSYHPCGVHATSVSGTHSAAGCGVSGHYVCDGSDHSLQASCTSTDSNGQYCTVTSFYACQTHTHVYPAPPAISCGRSGCTQTVSSSTAHQVTCSAGHQYWSCGQYANWHANHHRTRTCRFGRCGQTWQRCSRPSSAPTPMCADPTRSGQRCWAK